MTELNRQSEENEERIMEIEIEIERLRPFKEHPFQVKDDKEMFLLQESIEKYLLQVRKFYPMSIRRALHCFHICLEIYNQSQVRSDVENGQRILPLRLFLPPGVHVFQYRLSLPILEIVL